ncbi:WhiB family transcriptional regulator [Rhodococcus sp. P1Y]|uniref:WhiB family transcriptional regulator n=1 Tax=Rhodococcus sp. P1Y TaxID=1302308 RepID=UPI00137B1761
MMLTGHHRPRVDEECERGAWQVHGACRRLPIDIFFPPSGPHQFRLELQARSICAQCTVLNQCRSYAIDRRESHGIWGGLTARERKNLTPRRRQPLAEDVFGHA